MLAKLRLKIMLIPIPAKPCLKLNYYETKGLSGPFHCRKAVRDLFTQLFFTFAPDGMENVGDYCASLLLLRKNGELICTSVHTFNVCFATSLAMTVEQCGEATGYNKGLTRLAMHENLQSPKWNGWQ